MRYIYILLLILVFSLITLQLCSKHVKPIKSANDTIQITDGVKTVKIPIASLSKQMNRRVKARKGSEWQGMYLSKLLIDNGYDVKKYRNCTLEARDGMKVTISMEDIRDDNAFIAFMKEKKSKGRDLKLVMIPDPFEQRWLKYVNRIVLE